DDVRRGRGRRDSLAAVLECREKATEEQDPSGQETARRRNRHRHLPPCERREWSGPLVLRRRPAIVRGSRKRNLLQASVKGRAGLGPPLRPAWVELWTDDRLNDRLNCVEGRTQGTLEVVPLGQELR